MPNWIRVCVFLVLGGWPLAVAFILLWKLLPHDTTGGSPWVLLPGIAASIATTILAILAYLTAYWKAEERAPRFWSATAIYIAGCTAVVSVVNLLLQR